VVCTLFLLLATYALAQRAGQTPQPGQPPYGTPPTLPEERGPGRGNLPPDEQASPQQMSSGEVEQQIQQHLNSEPTLTGVKLNASATNSKVTLSGTVDNERQHDLAVRIAQSYAGDRQVVDKIKLRQ